MAGLLNQPQAAAPSPEVTRILIAEKKILAQPQIAGELASMMKAASDPADGIAQATIFLLKQIFSKAKETPSSVIVPAMQRVTVDVARVGQAAGLFKITPDLIRKAVQIEMQMFVQSAKSKSQGAVPAAAAPQPAGV